MDKFNSIIIYCTVCAHCGIQLKIQSNNILVDTYCAGCLKDFELVIVDDVNDDDIKTLVEYYQ